MAPSRLPPHRSFPPAAIAARHLISQGKLGTIDRGYQHRIERKESAGMLTLLHGDPVSQHPRRDREVDLTNQIFVLRDGLPGQEHPGGVDESDRVPGTVYGHEPQPHRIDDAARVLRSSEGGAGNGEGDVHQTLIAAIPHGENLGQRLDLQREEQFVGIAGGAVQDSRSALATFFRLHPGGAAGPGGLDPAVNRGQPVARVEQGDRYRIVGDTGALELYGLGVAHDVEDALDQLVVLHVIAGYEMEDHVAVSQAITPRLVVVHFETVVRGPVGRLAVPNVDDPAIVEVVLG
ncbi:MAG: hypothetical protein IH921_09465 [Gemmatimonadetes bacterium]|nr:hypothetical protein [Gemmatimonadota bacterium]